MGQNILSYRVILSKLVQIKPTKTVVSVEQTDMNGCPYWLLDEFTGDCGLPGPLPHHQELRASHREVRKSWGAVKTIRGWKDMP